MSERVISITAHTLTGDVNCEIIDFAENTTNEEIDEYLHKEYRKYLGWQDLSDWWYAPEEE